MPAKSQAGRALLQACHVCGGEVNAAGECTNCGAKQVGPPSTQGSATPAALAADASAEALRKWLAGDESSFQDWLGVPQKSVSPGVAGPPKVPVDEAAENVRAKALETDGLRAELESIRSSLSTELAQFRSGKFDPVKYIEETAALSRRLQGETTKRKELEQEIDHIKKGTIAVIKYMKAQQLKAGASPELKRKLADSTAAQQKLEVDIAQQKQLVGELRAQLEGRLAGLKPDERALKKREFALIEREAALVAKQETLSQAAKSDVAAADEELKRRLEEELRSMEQDYLRKEEDLKKRILSLEEMVSEHRIEAKLREEAKALESKPKAQLQDALSKKEQELLTKEKSILLREQEIQRLQEELTQKDDELRKLKEPLAYKEDEILRREEDLTYRERLLDAERRKLEEAKALGGSVEELELKQRLEELKGQINQKEEEVRTKEKYLAQKLEELRLREQGIIEEDIEARESDRLVEFRQEKVRTGIARLDDLLYGGIPFGANVSIYGPAYVGKEVVVNLFMAEGLKKGLPVVWVLTDKAPSDIREEMAFVLSGYEEYERLGLVRYVDAYSKSIGGDTTDPHTNYVAEPTDHQSILKAVDTLAADLKKRHNGYRIAFRSVSTLIAYLDPTTTFKFLQPFIGRRKRDKAVSYYVIEKGMHEDQEIQMLGSLMDGSIEFKVEQLKSFMSIKGVCDVQSRSWIRYTYTKGSVTIGSFSLDHIK